MPITHSSGPTIRLGSNGAIWCRWHSLHCTRNSLLVQYFGDPLGSGHVGCGRFEARGLGSVCLCPTIHCRLANDAVDSRRISDNRHSQPFGDNLARCGHGQLGLVDSGQYSQLWLCPHQVSSSVQQYIGIGVECLSQFFGTAKVGTFDRTISGRSDQINGPTIDTCFLFG